jgi:Ni,Fe-hydrogenase III small subunit
MSWFFKGLRKGVQTEDEPKPEHEPMWATKLIPAGLGERASRPDVHCPTDALGKDGWESRRCIFCRLCEPAYTPSGDHKLASVNRSQPAFRRSFHVFPIDVGSCGGCNTELRLIAAPQLDMTRFGIFFTGTPRHADGLIVMGEPNELMKEPLMRAYRAMPSPKLVIALGACALSGEVFEKLGIREEVLVPGCPPSPYTILDALIRAKGGKGW